MSKTMLTRALSTLVLMTPSLVGQGFLGKNVELIVEYPNTGSAIMTPAIATVGAGTEFSNLPPLAAPGYILADVDIDIDSHSVSIGFSSAALSFPSATFNGWVISDIDQAIPPITSANLNPGLTSLLGITPDRVTFTEDSISINVQGLTSIATDTLHIDVAFGATQATTVPYGSACPQGGPLHISTSPPTIGTTITVTTSNIAPTPPPVFGLTTFGLSIASLDLGLVFAGSSGCLLLNSADTLQPVALPTGSFSGTLSIPLTTSLIGLSIYSQGLTVTDNPFSVFSSSGLHLVLGT